MSTETELPKPTFPWLKQMPPASLVARYLTLRAGRAKSDAEHDEDVRRLFLNEMEAIEAEMVQYFAATGGKTFASDEGTAYTYTATSVTVSDQREFKRHVLGGEAYELIEWRANKTAVLEAIENGEPTPPGVNVNSIIKVGFRSPK